MFFPAILAPSTGVRRVAGAALFVSLLHGCAVAPRESQAIRLAVEKGPLQGADVMAFAVVRDTAATRRFYEETLGLDVLMDDAQALVLASGGTVVRLQKSAAHEPARSTVLGWKVPDIRSVAVRLREAGVRLERYEWMTFQDDSGIATFPGGDQVAWFKDPDGNILSIAQLK